MSDQPFFMRHAAVIEYVGLPVIPFYRALGFTRVVAREHPEPGYISILTGGRFSSVEILKLANGHGQIMEVISVPTELVNSPSQMSHIAVTVAGCQAAVKELTSLGGQVIGGPVKSPDGPFVVAYVRDASGNLVEVVEPI